MTKHKSKYKDSDLFDIIGLPTSVEQWLSEQSRFVGLTVIQHLHAKIVNEYLTSTAAEPAKTNLSSASEKIPPAPKSTPADMETTKSSDVNKYKGVYPYGKRWLASYVRLGNRYRIGTYDTAYEAAEAYDDEMERIGENRVNLGRDPTAAELASIDTKITIVTPAVRAQFNRPPPVTAATLQAKMIAGAAGIDSDLTPAELAYLDQGPLPDGVIQPRSSNEVPGRTPLVDDPHPRRIPVRRTKPKPPVLVSVPADDDRIYVGNTSPSEENPDRIYVEPSSSEPPEGEPTS